MAFDSEYEMQLFGMFPAEIVEQIVDDPKLLVLEHQEGETLPYVEVRDETTDPEARPIVFIPGFMEGIVNKASFAASLAMYGGRVILPDQNRTGMPHASNRSQNVTDMQANNYVSLFDEIGGSADIVSHSYGSLIFNRMVQKRPDSFADSNVVSLAPAGTAPHDNRLRLISRTLQSMRSESKDGSIAEFPDHNGVTGNASFKTGRANIRRSFLELSALAHDKVDYSRLSRAVKSLLVLTYPEDKLFPQSLLEPTLLEATTLPNVSWASPVDVSRVKAGELAYSVQGSNHDDEQFNPSRVARAVLRFLQPDLHITY